jgi:hypothetical protein
MGSANAQGGWFVHHKARAPGAMTGQTVSSGASQRRPASDPPPPARRSRSKRGARSRREWPGVESAAAASGRVSEIRAAHPRRVLAGGCQTIGHTQHKTRIPGGSKVGILKGLSLSRPSLTHPLTHTHTRPLSPCTRSSSVVSHSWFLVHPQIIQ